MTAPTTTIVDLRRCIPQASPRMAALSKGGPDADGKDRALKLHGYRCCASKCPGHKTLERGSSTSRFVIGERHSSRKKRCPRNVEFLCHALRYPPTSRRARALGTRGTIRPMRRALIAAVVAPFAVLACVSLWTPSQRRRNVLIVSIDTLRADRLGSYGYAHAQTPVLDMTACGMHSSRSVSASSRTRPRSSTPPQDRCGSRALRFRVPPEVTMLTLERP